MAAGEEELGEVHASQIWPVRFMCSAVVSAISASEGRVCFSVPATDDIVLAGKSTSYTAVPVSYSDSLVTVIALSHRQLMVRVAREWATRQERAQH